MNPTTIGWVLLAALPLFALTMTLFNVVTWPRGRREGRYEGEISICIPARNEQATIENCVRSAIEGSHPVHEVLVYDDESTDGTSEILAALCEEYDNLRVVGAQELPAGWVGKPHACHRLAQAADGDMLLFVDADTFLRPHGLARIASLFGHKKADLVTAVPRQHSGSFVERLIMPLLHLTYTAWFPLMLVYRSQDPRFLAANGQLLAVRRNTYDDIGGFEAVRSDVVDDMAICRLAKAAGHRVVFADGYHMADCRMYGSAREVWEGFSKNLYEGIGARLIALGGVLAVYFGAFVLPYVVAAGALVMPQANGLLVPALVGVGANVATRAVLALRFKQPVEGLLLHPVGVLGLLAIAINSFRWHRGDSIMWSGRTYAKKSSRSDT